MADALIGFSGFIGSNLLTQRKWDATFNRSNISELGGEFDTVVCCAAPGTKWKANADPAADWVNLVSLFDQIQKIRAERFILISTADVFSQPVDADELCIPKPDCAYGSNRRDLEIGILMIRERFQTVHIVRLPSVIGPSMKKGPIFDLQNEHRLEFLNPDSVYQWYDVRNLWRDIEHRTEQVIHLCPKPESLWETVERDYPHLRGRLTGTGPAASYNLRTIYNSAMS